MDTERGHGMLNRLYFLYEAYDYYWDFPSLIDIYHRDVWRPEAVGRARSAIDPRIEEAPRRISALQANYNAAIMQKKGVLVSLNSDSENGELMGRLNTEAAKAIKYGGLFGLSEIGAERVTVDTNEVGEFLPQVRALIAVNPDSASFASWQISKAARMHFASPVEWRQPRACCLAHCAPATIWC